MTSRTTHHPQQQGSLLLAQIHQRRQQLSKKEVKFSIEHRIYYSGPSFLDTQTNYVLEGIVLLYKQ